MSFKIIPDPLFTALVVLTVAGQEELAEITLTFRHKSKEALQDFMAGLPGRDDVSIVGEIVAGWSGVDAPYDEESLRVLLSNYPAASVEIYDQYVKALTESRRKN